jgi:hypothetical protein
MPKPLTLDSAFVHIRALRARPLSALTDADLLPLITSKHSAVATPAAGLIADARLVSLIPQLVEAFARFSADGAKTDKGCVAKLAIANALCALDYRDSDVYLRGVRTFQPEPSFGGAKDTAGELRGRCAEALVACLYPHALIEIAALLADDDAQCRIGAVRGAALAPGEAGAALLRLKLAAGDEEPAVLGEACAALLALDANLHVDFVASFLDPPTSEIAQVAIAALAESRSPAALVVLRRAYEAAITADSRKAALLAIAGLHIDGAPEFLLDLVERALHPRAREVIESLHPRKTDERFRQRLGEALARRDDKLLARYAEEVLSRKA